MKRQLGLRGIAYQENWRLVHEPDITFATAFEITAPGLGSQNAVCGGRRPMMVSWSCWAARHYEGHRLRHRTDRLILSLRKRARAATPGGLDVYAWFGAARTAAIGLARRLRDAGLVVELPAVELKFGKSLGLADRLKARHAVIVGDDELAAGVFTVKRLADGTQQKLAEQDLISYLRGERV